MRGTIPRGQCTAAIRPTRLRGPPGIYRLIVSFTRLRPFNSLCFSSECRYGYVGTVRSCFAEQVRGLADCAMGNHRDFYKYLSSSSLFEPSILFHCHSPLPAGLILEFDSRKPSGSKYKPLSHPHHAHPRVRLSSRRSKSTCLPRTDVSNNARYCVGHLGRSRCHGHLPESILGCPG